jgi:tetratricopeptide (TPR) repeat protein
MLVRHGRWLLILVSALGLAAQSWRAARLLDASRRLRAVEYTSTRVAAAGERAVPLLTRNLELAGEAERLDPANVAAPLFRGSLNLLLGRHAAAIEAYQDALRLEPRPEVYLNLGRAQLAAGDREAAEISFARLRALDPRLAVAAPALPSAPARGPAR